MAARRKSKYYPFNKVPNTPVYSWSKLKAYDEDPYIHSFASNWNPRFNAANYYVPCFMSGELSLMNLYDVWDKTNGHGYGSSTLDRSLVRSVGLFPEGTVTPTGQHASPEVHLGLSQQFSDDRVIKYSTHLNLPANSRCVFQLGLMCDVTGVGPRNGRWNRLICDSQLRASADFPRIDMDVWPLV